MQAPTNLCPQCGYTAIVPAANCPRCGHAYTMPYGRPSGPVQGQNPPPRSRSSFGALADPSAGNAPNSPVCSSCGNPIDLQSPFCRRCGADQRTLGHYVVPSPPVYAPAPQYAPPSHPPPRTYAPPTHAPYPTMYSPHLPYVRPPDDFEMFDLARQYQAAKKAFIWTLVLGLLFCPLVCIISYMEWNKMKTIKSRVALRGIDPEYWANMLPGG